MKDHGIYINIDEDIVDEKFFQFRTTVNGK